jgi:tRNA dihydrouridine synthase A
MHQCIAILFAALATSKSPSLASHDGQGNKNFEFHIAPMQCYTNQPFRILMNSLSPSSIKWTEMEKVEDLLPNVEQALEKRLGSSGEDEPFDRLVLQLGSNDPTKVKECVDIALRNYPNLKEINLNCGCPSIASGGAPTFGASLMKDPQLVAQMVDAIASNYDIPVSVKTRIAVFEHADDLRPLNEKDHDYLKDFISGIVSAGADHVILHARPAVLAGLSPVKNRIVPDLNYEICEEMANTLPHCQITLNGGITSLDQLKSFHAQHQKGETRISSYMAGRYILRKPLELVGIESLLATNQDVVIQKPFPMIQDALTSYIDHCLEYIHGGGRYSNSESRSDLMLPLFLVAENLHEEYHDTHNDNNLLLSYEQMEDLHDTIFEGMSELSRGKVSHSGGSSYSFKKLSTSFKTLVGTKVVNKWKRNRAEL